MCREKRREDTIARAARASPDHKTVALIFGTGDFSDLLINWACHAKALDIRWFVLVAMDAVSEAKLSAIRSVRRHVMLLPRVRDPNVTLNKFNVRRSA